MKSAHGFLVSINRKEIDMKKLTRIEPVKQENKKRKVAAYCRVSTKFESKQSSIDLQVSIIKLSYKVTLDENMQEFVLLMAVE